MKSSRTLGIALLALLLRSGFAGAQEQEQAPFSPGQWSKVAGTPLTGVGHALLLTDGSVLIINSECNSTGNWYRLVPNSKGSYQNGTWVSAGALPAGYNPLYFSSAVLPTGNVIIVGGEYNACNSVWTTLGALYNSKSNHWVSVAAPAGWTSVGDAQNVVLPNGKFMLANCCTTDEAIATISGSTVTWTPTGAGKADINDEEGWTLLPSGKVLTVDANNISDLTNSEIYTPSTGKWASAGSTVVQLDDTNTSTNSHELGPMVLRPNGTVIAAGATTNNAVYDIATATWSAAPKFGGALDVADGPAALLPDGNVLFDTSPGIYNAGTHFFEWDGTLFHAVPGPPNAAIDSSFYGNMVVLPTGQILFTDFSTDAELYTPSGSPCTGCAPTITSVASTLTHASLNNVIRGTQFNGLSQGAAYGDDAQSATNFPLVRITDSADNVVYCRTHSFTTMGVATGTKIVGAEFDIPSTIALGAASLEVVTNGIASTAVSVTID
jgi:hypothetical protein